MPARSAGSVVATNPVLRRVRNAVDHARRASTNVLREFMRSATVPLWATRPEMNWGRLLEHALAEHVVVFGVHRSRQLGGDAGAEAEPLEKDRREVGTARGV